MIRRAIAKALTRKGFESVEGKSHRVFRLLVGGLETGVGTVLSRGSQSATLGAPLVGKIATQLHITGEQFKDLVDCPLSHEGYVAILREKGFGV